MPPPLESLVRMRAFTEIPASVRAGLLRWDRPGSRLPRRAGLRHVRGGDGRVGGRRASSCKPSSVASLRSYDCLHTPELPAAVGPSSRVILLSYSGNTWEVLQAGDEAPSPRCASGRSHLWRGAQTPSREAGRRSPPVAARPPTPVGHRVHVRGSPRIPRQQLSRVTRRKGGGGAVGTRGLPWSGRRAPGSDPADR